MMKGTHASLISGFHVSNKNKLIKFESSTIWLNLCIFMLNIQAYTYIYICLFWFSEYHSSWYNSSVYLELIFLNLTFCQKRTRAEAVA
jgi:hypothetical protein